MLTLERQEEILAILRRKKSATVAELSQMPLRLRLDHPPGPGADGKRRADPPVPRRGGAV